jgi:hypothetical protein
MNFLVLNITHQHKLYNYFDSIKNKIAFKEDIDIYNLYNDVNLNFIPQYNDAFYKNDSSEEIINLNPADCEVKHVYEMFKKFYFFIKYNLSLIAKYDFIVRCNSSTFINFRKLADVLKTLPTENCYAGYKLNNILASGACNVFSKDVIQKIAETDIEQIPYKNNYDDVAISNLLTETYNIFPLHIDRYDYSFNREPTDEEAIAAFNYPVTRIRNNVNRELFDVQIWEKLFKLYRANYFAQQN